MRLRTLLLLGSMSVDLILLHNPYSSHAASINTGKASARRLLKVDLEVQAQTPGVAGSRRLTDGARINETDELVLRINVNQDAYVYVTTQDEKGVAEMLFPYTEAGLPFRLKARQVLRVPHGQGILKVTPPANDAVLHVIATAHPLMQQEAQSLGLRWPLLSNKIAGTAKKEEPAASPPPTEKSAQDEKNKRKTDDPCNKPGGKGQLPQCRRLPEKSSQQKRYALTEKASAQGIADLQFRLQVWH